MAETRREIPRGNIAEHHCYGGDSIVVWGGITWDGRTDLLVLNQGTLIAQRYRDEILDTQVRLYACAVGDQFILMCSIAVCKQQQHRRCDRNFNCSSSTSR